MRDLEHKIQCTCVRWFRLQYHQPCKKIANNLRLYWNYPYICRCKLRQSLDILTQRKGRFLLQGFNTAVSALYELLLQCKSVELWRVEALAAFVLSNGFIHRYAKVR